MYKYFLVTFFLLYITGFGKTNAQDQPVVRDSTVKRWVYKPRVIRDSAFLAKQKFVTDSIMTHTWILPDSLINKHILIDSIVKANVFEKLDLDAWFKKYSKLKKVSRFRTGNPLLKGQTWVLGFIVLLLVIFAILRISFAKQLQSIIQSFYSNRGLNNLNKEDNVFSSWPFLFLFIQFGFTIGMFFYLVAQYYQLAYVHQGFRFFVSVSILIVVLYATKILLLRVLGHLFNIQKAVHEYVSILYLSYFNISLIFIPLVVAFALSPMKYGIYYIVISFILLGIIFTFQFIRAGINILSHYRFSKFYLFMYFCALEICPILILIKAIGLEL
ncbi:hypothetical protein HDF26_003734 [Pedobacter cryoconitis]|uniref:DUF4271 domain-containing protein n=1 Tax=Pedobacter cryoconitis TaxID=188932 RepID=A0A7W9DY41_9SPHI|nr:DUF4271 domain-containing protein [Pedobacter cryoconitis]MBB5635827.1 hypothetical protein [Pedobacter cryoconitis]MBB6273274.1 hypothetical protein [Pedobacter cryoconitis]